MLINSIKTVLLHQGTQIGKFLMKYEVYKFTLYY